MDLRRCLKKQNAGIIAMGCTCHSFHLCASRACEKLPSTVEQFCRDIYNYFSNSNKRIKELKECEVFCAEKPHRMLRPAQTRWLPLGTAVARIFEH